MKKYIVSFSKKRRVFITTVMAETEKDAFLLAVKEAKSKGINVPDEVTTKINEVK